LRVKLEQRLNERLDDSRSAGLLRMPAPYDGDVARPTSHGRSILSFASNDYLGLASSVALRTAVAEAAMRHSGPGSSRAVAGTTLAHRTAERALAGHVALAEARLFTSAYSANVAVLGSLLGAGDLILSDELNHASIIDGCRLSRARTVVYRHGDLDHLTWLLREHAHTARVTAVVTETVFSMDADLADVRALRRLTHDHDAALIVDEAHALGVVGELGEGSCAASGVAPDVLVGGLGKAFGLSGGFVAGPGVIGPAIDNFARPMLFSTAILPAIAAAVPQATEMLRGASTARRRLQGHVTTIRAAAARGGRVLGSSTAPFVPVVIGDPVAAVRLSSEMRERGALVPVMRPPTVPAGTSRLRWSATASHNPEEVAQACDIFLECTTALLGSDGQREHQSEAAQR
jgi:8-amino-7-oxononanoate synthase